MNGNTAYLHVTDVVNGFKIERDRRISTFRTMILENA